MKLLELTTAGCRVPDRTYSLRAANGSAQPLVFVTGFAGSGKTSLLACIAAAKEGIAPYGAPIDARAILRKGCSEGSLRALWRLSDEELAHTGLPDREQATELVIAPSGVERRAVRPLRELFSHHGQEPGLGKLELFPAHRRLRAESWRQRHAPISPAIEDGRRLSLDDDKYAVLARVLHDVAIGGAEQSGAADGPDASVAKDAPTELSRYQDALSAMVPGLRLASVVAREGGVAVSFARPDGARVGLAELSSSEEQGVLFALAYAWLRLDHSVWLIDGPEHLVSSPAQADFLSRLSRLGTDNQLIVATGSDTLIAAARPAQLVDVTGAEPSTVVDAARGISAAQRPAPDVPAPRPRARSVSDTPDDDLDAAPESQEKALGNASPGPVAEPPAVAPLASPPPALPVTDMAGSAARRLDSSPWARSDPFESPAEPGTVAQAALPSPPATSALKQTQDVKLEHLLAAKPAVPFEGSAEPLPPSREARSPSEPRGCPQAGETAELTLEQVRAAAEAVPFSPKRPTMAEHPELTLEQYASYSAESTVKPSERARIMTSYGIASHAARAALSVYWGKRFEEEPELKVRFDKLQQQYVAWLRAQQG